MGQLAKLIAHDAGMTAKILNIANGSAYSHSGIKLDLVQSLNTLGIEMIKTLVINESVFQTFNNLSRESGADLRGFWVHALKAAVIARELAKKMSYQHSDEAYLAGLLHDVGRLALLAAAPEEYASNFMAADDDQLCSIEMSTLGLTHAEAGSWLVEQWNLDSFLADSVLYHHEPIARLKAAHPLIRIVSIAHLFSSYKNNSPTLQDAVVLCGIDNSEMDSILATVNAHIKTAITYFGIDLTDAEQLSPSDDYVPHQKPVSNRGENKLAEEVHNMALVSSAGQTFATLRDGKSMLESITQTARVLFSFRDTIVLLQNEDTQVLAGFPVGDQQLRLNEFLIPLGDGSIIAESVSKKRISFVLGEDKPPGIIDAQFLRAMRSECLVYMPLIAGQSCLGVLVGGLSSFQADELWGKERLLKSFATQAAISLQSSASARNEIEQHIARVNEAHREASRRVAHEVNNPLSIIKNYLGVLDFKLAKQEPVTEELSILNEEIDRVGRIVGALAQQQITSQAETTEVSSVLNDVVRLFSISRFLPPSVSIFVRGVDHPAKIVGSADPLRQILLNLIKNAVEAMPRGGKIEVKNNGRIIRESRAYIEVCIIDTGAGIPADVLANLFSPVRSSKSGENRGLGLSIVHNLVKKSNGFVSCRSGEWGTAFDVLLPAYDAADNASSEPKQVMNMK